MYTKYPDILAKACGEVLKEMAEVEVKRVRLKEIEKAVGEFAVSAYLLKPVKPSVLLANVRSALK